MLAFSIVHLKRRIVPLLMICFVAAFSGQSNAESPPAADQGLGWLTHDVVPFNVSDRAQLFVDRVLVRETERVWFTQHRGRKHPQNPLIRADQPWEGWRVYVYGDVLYDDEAKLFKMWYICAGGGEYGFSYPTCYATSKDGVHWEKPLVGTIPARNGKPHNVVVQGHVVSVIKDPADPDPQRRYKMIGWRFPKDSGYHTWVSPDGLNWTPFSTQPISPWGDVITGFWDPQRKLYVAFPKLHTADWRGHNRRLFYTTVSEDFVHWSKPILSWTTDLRDDAGALARLEQVRPILDRPDDPRLVRTEYYGIGAYPAESCTLGFPWVLTINNNARYGNHEGPQEIQLAVSRDLLHWERPFRTPVIAIGDLDQWDASYHTTAAKAIRVGDEIYLYYGGCNYTHGTPALYRATDPETGQSHGQLTKYTAGVGLVTWKLDRFVSADTPAEGGTLWTIPFTFRGNRLELNASTQPGGRIVVELCDPLGRPLPGFVSEPVVGNDLRHVVRFPDGNKLGSLAGKPVSLRFRMTGASLFSFAFRGDP